MVHFPDRRHMSSNKEKESFTDMKYFLANFYTTGSLALTVGESAFWVLFQFGNYLKRCLISGIKLNSSFGWVSGAARTRLWLFWLIQDKSHLATMLGWSGRQPKRAVAGHSRLKRRPAEDHTQGMLIADGADLGKQGNLHYYLYVASWLKMSASQYRRLLT